MQDAFTGAKLNAKIHYPVDRVIMKKIQLKQILILLFFILNLFWADKVFATTLTLNPSKESLGTGEQFYVDLMLDPQEESINAISGSINFPDDKVSFQRAEDGKSMVNLWVEKPKLEGNNISFAGVIPNGFDGVINPFDQSHKLPGLIIRLVFEAKNPGQIDFSTSTFSLNLNDGLGTEIQAPSAFISVKVGDFSNIFKYIADDNEIPELEAYVTRDPNIYNNKYVLVFKAYDRGTGIKSVMIKEGRSNWKEIESPYLLHDQSRHSTISLQAINFSGAGVSINIDGIPYDWKLLIKVASVIITIIIALSVLILKKKYANKK
jgi:hypothetical protein